jgi:hypothetical protein
MMRIKDIWLQLENDQSFSHGLLLRRFAGSIIPDVFVALKVPERIRCIAVSIGKDLRLDIDALSNLKDIDVEIYPDKSNPERKIVLFELLRSEYNDIFSVLCEDLMASIETVNTEPALIRELFNRFEKWKSLFETSRLQGLSGEEQRGLYGELFLLRKLLQFSSNQMAVLSSWVGCEKQIRDFQYNVWSIEVKTTHGNNHQRIHISNERQLDCSKLEHLFLFHLSLEARQQSGETLNKIVNSIRELLYADFIALNRFNAKLLEGGYFNHHETLYNDIGYLIRQEMFYRVQGNFPRIEEQDIRNGVGDVKYSIIVSQASEFVQSEPEVFQTLNFDE